MFNFNIRIYTISEENINTRCIKKVGKKWNKDFFFILLFEESFECLQTTAIKAINQNSFYSLQTILGYISEHAVFSSSQKGKNYAIKTQALENRSSSYLTEQEDVECHLESRKRYTKIYI